MVVMYCEVMVGAGTGDTSLRAEGEWQRKNILSEKIFEKYF